MQTIYRVFSRYCGEINHYKSFFKKEDAEIFLKNLKVKMIENMKIFDRNLEIRDKLYVQVLQEFSLDTDRFFDNEDAIKRYDDLCNATEFQIPEIYYTKEDIETVNMYEEDVF